MLKKENYSQDALDLFQIHAKNEDFDFQNMTHDQILQASYFIGAQTVSRFLKLTASKQANFRHLNLPRRLMYSNCDLSVNMRRLRGQNTIFFGTPGTGKTYSTVKLAKDYFCTGFIPVEYRESKDFFKGEYAHGYTNPSVHGKIVFVNEQHLMDMYGRDIEGISAFEAFDGNVDQFGAYDLKDLYNAGLLIVQDIGSTKAHPKYAETLFSILDSRLNDYSKITIFTTNVAIEDLTKTYGEMFFDRINGNFFKVPMEGDSKRKVEKINRFEPDIEFFHI